jgi:hypothetical protein
MGSVMCVPGDCYFFLFPHQFLEKNNIVDMNRENFSFSSKVLLGDFLQPTAGEDYIRLSEEQVMKRVEELRMARSFKSRSGSHRLEEAEFTLVQAG